MEWDEARRQCWLWGGELAFPLPNQQCTVVSYATETEEVIIYIISPVRLNK